MNRKRDEDWSDAIALEDKYCRILAEVDNRGESGMIECKQLWESLRNGKMTGVEFTKRMESTFKPESLAEAKRRMDSQYKPQGEK